ncbi:TniQ family protein (plasmid) [Nocardia sp. NBC_01377]|uniref:TniQ family protein n=1 Tax=Nocardia sp. NBC_01377 TaxID=2903595 RepID=UPI002F906973
MRRALPRRLPRTAAPAHHEIVASYLARLAALNHLDGDELWKSVSVPGPTAARRIVTAERMSALTGRPAEHLAGALPELRATAEHWPLFRHRPQPGCPRCDARHPGGPVWRILPHHRYVCTRHHYWIGPPDNDSHGPSLRGNREVIAAQRKHLRLVQHFGPGATYDAVLTAFMICAHRWEIFRPTSGLHRQQQIWRERSFQFMPAGAELSSFTASKLFACLYPEAVDLAPLIAAPRWRQFAASGGDQLTRFVAEVRRRLRDHDYQPQAEQDAIAHWIATDCWRPPTTPPNTFATARGNRKPSQVGRMKLPSAERTIRSAAWFALKDRRGMGDAVLHHVTLRPVIIREWSPDMQEFRGAIWNSQRTDKRFRQPQSAN